MRNGETNRCCCRGLQGARSFMSQGRKNSARGKVIDKKWFIRRGLLWGLQAGRQALPGYLVGYIFILKGREGKGRRPSLSFLSRCHAFITSSSSRLGFLSLHGQARPVIALWKDYFRSQYNEGLCLWNVTFHKWLFFCVCKEHALGVINLLTPLGRLQALFSTIVLLFRGMSHASVAWFCC